MSRSTLLRIALVALVALVAPRSASAQSTVYAADGSPQRWHRPALDLVVDAQGGNDAFAGLDALVASAAARWAAVPGVPAVRVTSGALQGLGYDRALGPDAQRSGVTVYRDAPPPGASERLAVTLVSVVRGTGRIVDADVVFNAARFRFQRLEPRGMMGAPAGGRPVYDLESVLMHELGHALGLGEDARHDEATMHGTASPGEVSKRDLHEIDEDSARAAYAGSVGAGAGAGAAGGVGTTAMAAGCGGARISPVGVDRGAALAVAGLALLLVAVARARLRKGAVLFGALAVAVGAAGGGAEPAGVRAHERATVESVEPGARADGVVTTRADVVDARGARRSIELLGGRVGAYDVRVFDAPGGLELVPGATVELDGDRVIAVHAPPTAN